MSQSIQERIEQEIAASSVVLFMKGTPEQPMCGFSAQVVQALKKENVPFHAIDVLQDWDIREGIKEYANWPTIPQLYVRGEFIGGCDIIMDLCRKGEFSSVIKGN